MRPVRDDKFNQHGRPRADVGEQFSVQLLSACDRWRLNRWAPAFDPSEKAIVGVRTREWTAVAPTEVEVVLEMARCLREIVEGRVPKWPMM